MARLMVSPRLRSSARWAAVLPTAFGFVFVGFYLGDHTYRFIGSYAAFALFTLVSGIGVYASSRVAPSHRRGASLVSAGALLLVGALLFPWSGFDFEGAVLCASALLCVVVGAWLAWRRAARDSLDVVRLPRGGALRYKGTTPFQSGEIDRDTFFGRTREKRSVLSLVLAERLVVLFGKSGTGKSSLINAGLIEPLRELGHFVMTVRIADRTRDPVDGLLAGVRTAADEDKVEIINGDMSGLEAFFRTAEFWSADNDLLQPVLVVDQFEELFTLHAPEPRRDFIRQLGELMRGRASSARSGSPSACRTTSTPMWSSPRPGWRNVRKAAS